MAVIKTYTIPDQHVAELIVIFGKDYQEFTPDVNGELTIPNTQSKANFASQKFDEEVRRAISTIVTRHRYEVQQAAVTVDLTDILE